MLDPASLVLGVFIGSACVFLLAVALGGKLGQDEMERRIRSEEANQRGRIRHD